MSACVLNIMCSIYLKKYFYFFSGASPFDGVLVLVSSFFLALAWTPFPLRRSGFVPFGFGTFLFVEGCFMASPEVFFNGFFSPTFGFDFPRDFAGKGF